MLAKFILPWFGGVAAIWAVCLLFFQTVLLLGYLYAHLLTRKFPPRAQGWIHAALLALSVIALPIVPKISRIPAALHDPASRILVLLTATIGLPYFLLSSTSPLLQAWYSQARAGAAPYRFYALSNAGSMLALLTYPVVFEPQLSNAHQALAWSASYALVAALCAGIGILPRGETENGAAAAAEISPPPNWRIQSLWVALPACSSALLLAITNHISQNIAAVPLLWVVPLSIYLLTFIVCFDSSRWYHRNFFLLLLGFALASMAYALSPSFAGLPFKVLVALFCVGLFACCMFCHGELVRLKPHPAYLTRFYLMISLGGAAGALFVAIVAPHIFSWYYELEVALAACAILVLIVRLRDPGMPSYYQANWRPAWLIVIGLVVIALIASLSVTAHYQAATARLTVRNFYGVLRVVEEKAPNVMLLQGASTQPLDDDPRYRKLMNGTIDHGLQFYAPRRRRLPTTYYGESSGIGIALRAAGQNGALRIGAIGLGAGTLAAYGRAGDRYTFYEINPLDVELARKEFTYLQDTAASVDIVMGDARRSLEQESPQQFDVIAVDAFSGDSIPIHLLTLQAFELYFRQLAPDGVLAVHISNQFVNLEPVVAAAATALDKEAVLVNFGTGSNLTGTYPATWILVGARDGFMGETAIEKVGTILPATGRNHLWTDDYSSLFRVLK